MTHARFRNPAMLLAAAALTAAPALAQQQYDRYYGQETMRSGRDQQVGGSWQYDQPRQSGAWQTRGQQEMQDQRWQQQNQWQRGQQQPMSRGGGDWVRIAVDFDNDGNFDSYHTVNRQELAQLRMSGAGRMGGGMQQQEWRSQTPTRFEQDRSRDWQDQRSQDQRWQDQRWDQQREFESRLPGDERSQDDRSFEDDRLGRQDRAMTGQQQTVSGEIESLNTVRFSGMRDEHILARVQAQDGRVHNVDLGPRRTLSNLDLNEGDRITLTALRGQINQRPVLLATSVQAGGRSVNVQRSMLSGGTMDTGQMQRVSGQVLRTWESTFEHNNQDHLLALVRLDNGQTKLIDLGPEDRLDDLNIGRNDEITLVGKPVMIDGIPALCVRTIEHENRQINIEQTDNTANLRTEEGDTDRQLERSGRVD